MLEVVGVDKKLLNLVDCGQNTKAQHKWPVINPTKEFETLDDVL